MLKVQKLYCNYTLTVYTLTVYTLTDLVVVVVVVLYYHIVWTKESELQPGLNFNGRRYKLGMQIPALEIVTRSLNCLSTTKGAA